MLTDALTLITAYGPHWGDGSGPGPAFFPLIPIVFWLLVIAGVITAIVLRGRRARSAPRREAETRLATRFAAGEIDEDEFRTRRAVLREKG